MNREKKSAPPHRIGPPAAAPPQAALTLSLEHAPLRAQRTERSSDPYNTTGSFDRTKHWARVGKR